MCRSLICVVIFFPFLFFSCARKDTAVTGELLVAEHTPASVPVALPVAKPIAILQAGEFPLWFKITPDGPVLIESIRDTVFSEAFIPWPLATHIRFILASGGDLLMAANQSGIIRFSPRRETPGTDAVTGIGLYFIPGSEFWRQYTVGAFFLFEEKPFALLYRNDRFFNTDTPVPDPRQWAFNQLSALPENFPVPALDAFPPEDGWNIDSLFLNGGFWYYRAVNRTAAMPVIRMHRTGDFSREGETVSVGVFQNSAWPEPFFAAPETLQNLFAAAFPEDGEGVAVTVVSPEFPGTRSFSNGRDNKKTFSSFYSYTFPVPTSHSLLPTPHSLFFIATDSSGAGMYVQAGTVPPVRGFSLPSLPEGFIYTGIGVAGDTVFAAWEEQAGYSIGSAGFTAMLLSALIR